MGGVDLCVGGGGPKLVVGVRDHGERARGRGGPGSSAPAHAAAAEEDHGTRMQGTLQLRCLRSTGCRSWTWTEAVRLAPCVRLAVVRHGRRPEAEDFVQSGCMLLVGVCSVLLDRAGAWA